MPPTMGHGTNLNELQTRNQNNTISAHNQFTAGTAFKNPAMFTHENITTQMQSNIDMTSVYQPVNQSASKPVLALMNN